MKFNVQAFALLAILLFTVSPGAAQNESGVVSADQILNKVVNPPLTRSLLGPVPETRQGLQFQGGVREFGDTRSLTMVATSVRVERDANVSLVIHFKLNSSTELAGPASEKQLAELLSAFKSMPAGETYLIEGHTCILGSAEANSRLSLERANFIAAQLVRSGVPASALQAIGCGAAEANAKGVKDTDGEVILAPYRKVILFKKMK